jgi:hypothetical protein
MSDEWLSRDFPPASRSSPLTRHSSLPLLALLAVSAVAHAAGQPAVTFSGTAALKHAAALCDIGPRVPGTPGHEKAERYILKELEALGLKPEVDAFTAATPLGPRPMRNFLVRFPGQSDRAVMVGGHYDTKYFTQFRFVGANDGGSSAGLLLELARVLKKSAQRPLGVWLAFLDGEEAFGEWTAADSLYGSRHLAERLRASGQHRKLDAFILVDMIGDRNLDLLRDLNSAGWLNEMVREVAAAQGLSRVFGNFQTAIEDDHMPLAGIGVPVVDLIDFNYGPDNSFWHTAQDTPDKLSARSLEAVGRIVLGTINALAKRK